RYFEDRDGRPVPHARVKVSDREGDRKIDIDTGSPVFEKWVAPAEMDKRDGGYFHREKGLALQEVTEKMSKSRGNVINPDDVVRKCGADVLRIYELFIGPLEASCPWSMDGIEGMRRFLLKAWRTFTEKQIREKEGADELEKLRHQTIRKVGRDIERFAYNTAISQLMVYLGELAKHDELSARDVSAFTLLVSPFAPHLAEEIWERLGKSGRILHQKWPEWDEEKTKETMISLGILVNGKKRGSMEVEAGANAEKIREIALEVPNVKRHIEGKTVRKVIVVKSVVNIVVK
ncbi:MAG: class I tRNA ligase family protein, partial [Pseudomonadota bacterium]